MWLWKNPNIWSTYVWCFNNFNTHSIYHVYPYVMYNICIPYVMYTICHIVQDGYCTTNQYIYIIRLYQMWLWKNPEKPMKNPHLWWRSPGVEPPRSTSNFSAPRRWSPRERHPRRCVRGDRWPGARRTWRGGVGVFVECLYIPYLIWLHYRFDYYRL